MRHAPTLALVLVGLCALAGCAAAGSRGSGGDSGTASGGPAFPKGVEMRASCTILPPPSALATSEQALMEWLDSAPSDDHLQGMYEFKGGGPCDRGTVGEVDWASQHLAFLRGSGRIERMRIRGSTLVVFQEIERQCGGAEMPLFQPGTAVFVVPSSVQRVEWKSHSEPCEWEKKGLPPPP